MLFTPAKIGLLTLRNRSIRAAAFEGMCPGHLVSESLLRYHRAVAAGGIGMTTVAYASVTRSGLSFPHQLWLRKEALPGLRALTDAVHREGAAASIQIGHCGNMAKASVSGRPLSPDGRFNLYGPSWPRRMNSSDITSVTRAFGDAVRLAGEAGFDAVEVHAGHGYLISQFLSPYSNHRRDEWGGPLENRTRFLQGVIRTVMDAAGSGLAVLVKMNLRDGFAGGMETEESVEVARMLEADGVHALVLSGGFVSKAPMYVMRGRMPLRVMSDQIPNPFVRYLVRWFGNILIRPEPFREAFFLEDALKVRAQVKIPLVYVGGLTSRESIDLALSQGFEFVALARALVHDPAFLNKLKSGEVVRSGCDQSNYCIAVMYTGEMACHQNVENLKERYKKDLGASSAARPF
jgi:2,4-dienoyl-CoA reductase-like NADH-dependent reductase (Old Yellow Enzyme family)